MSDLRAALPLSHWCFLNAVHSPGSVVLLHRHLQESGHKHRSIRQYLCLQYNASSYFCQRK